MVREEDLPIDIYFNKLLDWLIDRRHCNVKWQEKASVIREKINTAIQDMPANEEITHLLSGTYINYFHCKRIVELLKDCGEGSTNFFGKYSSKRMKDWQEILQAYTQENVHLAESAHMLMRNVNFEVPALKQQIAKCQQTQRECIRKQNHCTSNSSTFKEKYLRACKQMGIMGDNVRNELMKLVDKLPEIFQGISEKVKELDPVVSYYRSFVKFVAQNDNMLVDDITPLVKFVIDYGNATVYQWKTGEVPASIQKDVEKVDLDAMAAMTVQEAVVEDGEIDWGFDDEVAGTGDDSGIDYGDVDIDWGDGGNDVDISAFTIEDAGLDNTEGGGVATGSEALSIMENTATRNVFIDELLEMQAFLEQRTAEMNEMADMITVKQLQSASEIIQIQTTDKLRTMLNVVSSIITELTSLKMQNLYLIQNSPRYVDRIADSLEQKLNISQKLVEQIRSLEERSQKALQVQTDTEPKLCLLVKKTKELQRQMETEISQRYKNRTVNIMGEINTI